MRFRCVICDEEHLGHCPKLRASQEPIDIAIDTKCPHCGCKFEGATSLDNIPKINDGDISVCIKCTGVGIFRKGKVLLAHDSDLDHDTLMQVVRIRGAHTQMELKGWKK